MWNEPSCSSPLLPTSQPSCTFESVSRIPEAFTRTNLKRGRVSIESVPTSSAQPTNEKPKQSNKQRRQENWKGDLVISSAPSGLSSISSSGPTFPFQEQQQQSTHWSVGNIFILIADSQQQPQQSSFCGTDCAVSDDSVQEDVKFPHTSGLDTNSKRMEDNGITLHDCFDAEQISLPPVDATEVQKTVFRIGNVGEEEEEVKGSNHQSLQPEVDNLDRDTSNIFLTAFYLLPDEMVLHIFGFLRFLDFCKMGQVCQRFLGIIRDMWTQTKIDLLMKKLRNTLKLRGNNTQKNNNNNISQQRAMHWWNTALMLPNTPTAQIREMIGNLKNKTSVQINISSSTAESKVQVSKNSEEVNIWKERNSFSFTEIGAVIWLLIYPLLPDEATFYLRKILQEKVNLFWHFSETKPDIETTTKKQRFINFLLPIIIQHAALSWTAEQLGIFMKYLSDLCPLSWLLYYVPTDETMSLRCKILVLTHGFEETVLASGLDPRTDIDAALKIFINLSNTLNWSRESQIRFATAVAKQVPKIRCSLGCRIALEIWGFQAGCCSSDQALWNMTVTLTAQMMGTEPDWFESAEWIRTVTDPLSGEEMERFYREIVYYSKNTKSTERFTSRKLSLMNKYLATTWQMEGREDRRVWVVKMG
jgi:hypothetical protein